MKKKSKLFVFFGWVLFVLSACGRKEMSEDGWLAKLDKLATETIIERSDGFGDMAEDGTLEIVIAKIHPGSFTQPDANEIFLDCWFKGMPHVGGLDSRAGILLNADTMTVIAYQEYLGDEITLSCPRTAKGQNRILCLRGSGSQGTRVQYISLWSVNDGRWEALPTGIAECVQYEKKGKEPFEISENEFEITIYNGFCYMDEVMYSGSRLAVAREYGLSGLFEPDAVPAAELAAILIWNPYTERFEVDGHAVQPDALQALPD